MKSITAVIESPTPPVGIRAITVHANTEDVILDLDVREFVSTASSRVRRQVLLTRGQWVAINHLVEQVER